MKFAARNFAGDSRFFRTKPRAQLNFEAPPLIGKSISRESSKIFCHNQNEFISFEQ